MKKIIAVILAVTLLAMPLNVQSNTLNAQANTIKRYTTQTVTLKQKANAKAKTVYKVKANTKLTVRKTGKVWVRVKYKGKTLYTQKKHLANRKAVKKYTGRYFRRAGVIRWDSHKFTWYSQRVLPGRGLKIPGRHVDGQGFVCDKYGYIVLGSSTKNRGKIIPTPFGKFGKVYDAGAGGASWFDVYTNF